MAGFWILVPISVTTKQNQNFSSGSMFPIMELIFDVLKYHGYLGSQATPPRLGRGELVGSNPTYPTIYFIAGSSSWLRKLRTADFQSANTGSTPVLVTIFALVVDVGIHDGFKRHFSLVRVQSGVPY